jgi:hypothetical protein
MRRTVFILALVPALSCVADPRDDNSFETGSASTASASATTTGGSTSEGTTETSDSEDPTGSTSGLILDVGADDTDGTTPEIAEVFGHSGSMLYRMDPETKAVTEVGAFTGCTGASIIDIALDADSRMFGTSYSALHEIDKDTGVCTLIAQGEYPTSLSFVPAGTVDPDEEALVGFVDEEYIRIDIDSGAITNIGTLSDGLASSGDIVSVKDGGTYLTVYGPGCEDNDCIIQIDPANGAIIEHFGPLPYDQVFGLAFWAGRAYGFARGGELFEIEFVGDSVLTMLITIPGAPANLEFFGAGSTTSAPPAAG